MTKHTRKISNEKIITALLQHGTVTEAAEAAGTTPSTIYDRMKGRKFRADYMDAKNDVICKAVYSITAKVSEAIDTVADIMNDADINPAIRLQIAQAIVNNAAEQIRG